MNNSLKFDWTRVNNDVNGNPRYVVHHTDLLTAADREDTSEGFIHRRYQIALKKAKKLGGRKYHNKSYGGGIVFQSYNIQDTENKITELLGK